MKKKFLKAFIVLFSIASIYVAIYLIMYKTVGYNSENVNLSFKHLEADNSVTTEIGSNSFGVSHTTASILEAINKNGINNLNKFKIPRENGRLIFCIEHGGKIHANGITTEELRKIFEEKYAGETYTYECGDGHYVTKEDATNTYYSCVGDHREALPDLAYIITEPEDAKYIVPDVATDAVIEQSKLYREIITHFNSYNSYMNSLSTDEKQKMFKELFKEYYAGNKDISENINDLYNDYVDYWHETHDRWDWDYDNYDSFDTWFDKQLNSNSSTVHGYLNDMIKFINGRTTYEEYYSYYKYCFEEGLEANDVFYEYNDYLAEVHFGVIKETIYEGDELFKEWIDEVPRDDLENGIVDYLPGYEGGILYKYSGGEVIGEDIKQIAIWLRDGSRDGISNNVKEVVANSVLSNYYSEEDLATVPFYDIATRFLEESKNYEIFGEQLLDDESNAVNLQDTTNYKEVELTVDSQDDYEDDLILGPFSMTYIEGTYGGVTFGGISDMYLEGYNADNEIIDNHIEVEEFFIGSVGEKPIKPDYFKPSIDDKRYTDYTDQAYPKSGETFFIKIKDPNIGKEGKGRIKNVKIKVEFQWMRAEGTVCYLDGGRDKIMYDNCYHTYHCDGHSYTKPDGSTGTRTCAGKNCCHDCHYTLDIKKIKMEDQNAIDAWGTRKLYSLTKVLGDDEELKLDISMELGGKVWVDGNNNKESKVDGLYATVQNGEKVESTGQIQNDRLLKNVKVTLYEYDQKTRKTKVAELMVPYDKNSEEMKEYLEENDLMNMVNPTYTDENGEYKFIGLDTTKKYYVLFEYNGQEYMPTEYLVHGQNGDGQLIQYSSVQEAVGDNNYITENWKQTSKATEANADTAGVTMDRDTYDKQFEEIGSSPANYKTSNSLGISSDNLIKIDGQLYNETFSKLELMGYVLNSEGKYEQTGIQLIDGFIYEYDQEGNFIETNKYAQGLISTKIREYIENQKIYPSEEQIFKTIYPSIYGKDTRIMKMLQFIEDCKIEAYTGSPLKNAQLEMYPVYDDFEVSTKARVINGVVYQPIYDGQYYINLGLWERQEFDAALRKDVYKAALKINDKTVVYNYDKRNQNNGDKEGTNNENGVDYNTYWDINVRMSDYEGYYNKKYNREIYETDYVFNNGLGFGDGHEGDPLEIYITYKITVRNQSQSIMTEIKEVVDFYDKDYTYKPNLSWVMYQEGENTDTSVDKNSYYEMMDQEQEVINDENTSAITFIKNDKGAKVAKDANVDLENSKYGTVTHSDIAKENGKYQDLYVRGLENKKLATGESAYIYLTFQVNKENDKVILDGGEDATSDTPKENLAEINGYKTYYADNTKLPNGVNKTSENISGLLDRDSNPGNLEAKDLEGDKYEKNFEDDTDRAPSLRVLIDEDAVRNANGTVWEDERNKEVDDSIIGDGIRAEGEIGVKGVTVQLVEKCNNGTEYIWYETTTVDDGKYGFDKEHLGDGYIGYIPGDYVIRFYYGDKQETAISGEYGGANVTAYNGQDFKSTVYQTGINQEEATDIDGRYQGYVDTQNQNESVKYNAENGTGKNKVDAFVYDIYASDYAKENYSDAKDIWSRREDVIKYSAENVTNHKAEVLASPYQRPSYNGTEYSDDEMNKLYKELMDETYMTAETGMIVVEFEYDRQQSDGLNSTQNKENDKTYAGDNAYNSNYTLNNIDFGLVERPKAQLEIDKSVANVKVTLANGSILFDINKATNNAIWKDHEEYSIDEGKKSNGMYKEYYGEDHRYAYRTVRNGIDDIVANTDKGLIQLTMDEELMHGATIQIEYTVKITNVGEIDYSDDTTKDFYYKGIKDAGATIVTTTTNQVIDYVQNNLQFVNNAGTINDINTQYVATTNQQNGWNVIIPDDITGGDLVNNRLAEKLPKFNTIIQTGNFAEKALVPDDGSDKAESTITKTLILTQMITPENESDDLTYDNMVEIVKTSNTVGRRMAYSVVGNQDPLANEPAEVDTSMAEKIVILPPFGEVRMYYILGAIIAILLIGGIVLIKKKVLKGKD